MLTSPLLLALETSGPDDIMARIFGPGAGDGIGSMATTVADIAGRLLLAVVLSGILALRPRRNIRLFRRNLHVSQTEILLAVVAAALMMVVGDNAARAFGIFAAVSLVRFRTNIRDPKEIAVLLISMALGLAAGVGRWELGIVLCLFSLVLLWLLEHDEPAHVYRSMQLKVKSGDPHKVQPVLSAIFSRHDIIAEVREMDPHRHKKHPVPMVYNVTLPLKISTDDISEEILRSGAAETGFIESIQWEQQKRQTAEV